MAGKVRHMLNRDGRYFARLVIPKDLRPFMDGKSELRTALGADYRQALKLLHGAVGALQHQIALAERRGAVAGAGVARAAPFGRYPLAANQIAAHNYQTRLAEDDELRGDSRYASFGYVDDDLVQDLRNAMAGKLGDYDLQRLVGLRVAKYRHLGNTTAEFGTTEWRTIARALCVSEYEALARTAERDDGDFIGIASHPIIANAPPPPAEQEPPLLIRDLFRDYIAKRQYDGRQKDGGKRQEPVIENLINFVKHDDARRLTWREISEWRDHLLKTLAPKTVSDIYLSAVKSLLEWARVERKIPENVAADVKQTKPKRVLSREIGYTYDEATAVIKASRSYEPLEWINGLIREHPASTAAKRWVPILCAFTGARVSEMTQLRKEDFRKVGDTHVLRITPDAGTVKAGGYRDVPIHKQIIDEGFINFVNSCDDGSLFSRSPSHDLAKQRASAKRLANSLGEWLQELKLVPEGLWPNHAFRHRFKTVGRELGSSDRVMDAICGHASKTKGDDYGDVTIVARLRVITVMPEYKIRALPVS